MEPKKKTPEEEKKLAPAAEQKDDITFGWHIV